MSAWIFVIVFAVLVFGIFMNHMAIQIIEDHHLFLLLAAIFFAVYIGAAALVAHFIPPISGSSNVSSIVSFFNLSQI